MLDERTHIEAFRGFEIAPALRQGNVARIAARLELVNRHAHELILYGVILLAAVGRLGCEVAVLTQLHDLLA